MTGEDLLRQAVDTAWNIYRATHMLTRRTNGDACSSDICNRGGRQESMIAKS